MCAGIHYGGTVAACGLAQGMDLPASVAPFILRGITLAGIDSVMRPLADRIEAWQRLGETLSPSVYENISKEISLNEVINVAQELIEGKVQGRVIVNIAST